MSSLVFCQENNLDVYSIIQEVKKLNASYQEDNAFIKRQIDSLFREMQEYQMSLQKLYQKTVELEKNTKKNHQKSLAIQQELEKNMEEIKILLQQEKKERIHADKAVLKEILYQLSHIEDHSLEANNPSGNQQVYTVEKGDTLSAIATAFNVPLKTLVEHNKLRNDVIVVGQKLKIPEHKP